MLMYQDVFSMNIFNTFLFNFHPEKMKKADFESLALLPTKKVILGFMTLRFCSSLGLGQ